MEDQSIVKIGHNIKYDIAILKKYGIETITYEDTMLMSYVLDAGKNRHNMDTLSEIHLNHKTISFKELVGTGKNQINFSEVGIQQAKDYAAEDADITFQLKEIFQRKLDGSKSYEVFKKIEMPLIPVLSTMEMEGIKIDVDALADFSKDFTKIKDLALKDKQLKAVKKWLRLKIEETFVNVNKLFRDCSFSNNWTKQ